MAVVEITAGANDVLFFLTHHNVARAPTVYFDLYISTLAHSRDVGYKLHLFSFVFVNPPMLLSNDGGANVTPGTTIVILESPNMYNI